MPRGTGLQAEVLCATKMMGMEISLLETGVAPCNLGPRHLKESGLWWRVPPMATTDLWLGWGLLVAPGPSSELLSETCLEMPLPPSSSKGLMVCSYPWEGANPTKVEKSLLAIP